jgi:hypothetical protein
MQRLCQWPVDDRLPKGLKKLADNGLVNSRTIVYNKGRPYDEWHNHARIKGKRRLASFRAALTISLG